MISFLFVDTERVWRGGQEQLFTLMEGLARRGHRIHLACPPGTPLAARAGQAGALLHPLSVRSEVGPLSLLRLARIMGNLHPEVLAFNTPRAILIGNLASRLTRTTRARIIFRRVNFPLKKTIFTRVKYTWGIDCIITISEAIRQQLQAGGIPASKLQTIYEGIELSLFPRRSRDLVKESGQPVVVGTVAHMSLEKGMKYLVEAASLIPEADRKLRFVLVGDGACLPELKEMVQRRGLQYIFQFEGFQPNPARFLDKFDIFVLPSLSEGLSSAILEAMATSLPVVASRTGGIPEIVRDGYNGLLVKPGDPGALAHAIDRLTENREEARLMGERGRAIIEQQFSMERKILETESLCRSLLDRCEHLP